MGKAGKWLRLFLTGKKEKEKCGSYPSPLPIETRSGPISIPAPKEKRRWSFRRSTTATGMDQKSPLIRGLSDSEMNQKRCAMAAADAVATEAAADAAAAAAQAAAAAAQAAAAVIRLTATATNMVEEAAAIKIQAVFRSYLAWKALCALKGLVKLQALVRGHLVRRQATATLRCMQALVTAQARARAQRIRMLDEAQAISHHRQNIHRRSLHEPRSRQSYDMEENVKIVEMDLGESRGSSKSRNSYSFVQTERRDHKLSTYSGSRAPFKGDHHREVSPAGSTLTDRSPRACSGHFGEFSFATAQSSLPYLSASSKPDSTNSSLTVSQDYPLFPNYMANTESSRAKARSHSAPKQRTDSCERPPSRRRPSVEGRNIPRGVRMQRSSSHVSSATADGYRHPWSIKLDRSSVSLQESECGSTSTVLTNTNYCRSLMAYEVRSELSLDINS